MEELNISVAQLRAARGFLGWTQTDLARAAGVSKFTISRLENKGEMVSAHTGILRVLNDIFKTHNINFTGNKSTLFGVEIKIKGNNDDEQKEIRS